jgi:hypothetical protein
MPEAARVIYIFAAGHSGSTLLASLLGAQKGAFNLGEIGYLAKFVAREGGASPRGACTCGAPTLAQCPFWSAVDRMLARRSQPSLAQLDISSHVTRLDGDLALFDAAASVGNAPVLIDATKNYRRLLRLMQSERPRILPVILIGDPRKIVYSMRDKVHWAKHATKLNRIGIRLWTAYRLAKKKNLRPFVLTYDELALAPAETVARLARQAGLDYERQLDWTAGERHDLGGNGMRFSTNSAIRVDRAWQSGLSLRQKLAISLLSLPYLFFTQLVILLDRRRDELRHPTEIEDKPLLRRS